MKKILLVSALCLAACSPPPPSAVEDTSASASASAPAPAATLTTADKDISKVSKVGKTVVVDVYYRSLNDEKDIIDAITFTSRSVGVAVAAGAPEAEGASAVKIVTSIDTVDRLGHTSPNEVMTLTFDADDFRKADWNNITIAGSLDLVKSADLKPIATKGAAAWCKSRPDDAPTFCGLALK